MASAAPNRNMVARAAAILTTGEVAASSLDLNDAFDSKLTVEISFTLGSLTNGIFRFYASKDGTTFEPLEVGYDGTATVSRTYTGDQDIVIPVNAQGWKFFRVSVQGTGTVTSSSATVTYRWLRRGTQK